MKALLVYPRYPDTFWSFSYVLPFIKKKAAFPPLGLMTIASMLPKQWEKRLVDLNVSKLDYQDIAWADIVFISAMIVQKDSAQETIDRCKGKIVVAGGPAFTSSPNLFHGVDHFVINEAELTLPMFLRDFEKGQANKVYSSPDRPDITLTPTPDWSLIKFKDYAAMAVQYSRGCPFNCEFCDIVIMNGRSPRTKSPDQMISELGSLYSSGWRGTIFIVDDNFIGNKVNVKEFLPKLIEWQKERKYPFKFLTEASVNLADDQELMALMSKANFFKVFLGIETPSIVGLEECGKFQNVSRDLIESTKIIQRNGMQVMAGFIVGFDSDPDDIFEKQISFIQKTGISIAMVGMLNALPKTRLWERLKAEGRLVENSSGENTDGNLNFLPKMGKDELLRGYKTILSNIYSSKQYYERIETFLENYRPTVKSRISRSDLYAFFRSTWRVGIVSRSRFRYWKLFAKTLVKKTRSLPIAIELSILGLHFEKTSKKIINSA